MAQQDPVVSKGFEPDKLYQVGDVDSVDTTTGRVGIVLPIGPRFTVNGGFSYGLKVSYNSNMWDYVIRNTTCGTPPQPCSWLDAFPNRTSNAGVGWLLTLGRLYDGRDTKNPISGSSTYVSPDGAEHPFSGGALHYGEPLPSTDGTHTYVYTTDGSYLRMQTTPSNDTTRIIEHPDGTIDTFSLYDTQNYYWRLTSSSDRLGNAITVTYSDNTPTANWTITDSQGRTQHVYFGTNGYVSQVVLTAFGGTTATYSFGYTTTTIARSCQDIDPQDPPTLSVTLLSSISLPDASSYTMPQYHSGCDVGADASGVLEKLVLPTGGQISYQWQEHSYIASAALPPPCPPKPAPCLASYKQSWAAVSTRAITDQLGSVSGTWTYQIWTGWDPLTNVGIPLERRVVVTDPNQNDTIYYSRAYPADFGTNYDDDQNMLMWDYALPYTRRCQSSTSACTAPFLSAEYYQGRVVFGTSNTIIGNPFALASGTVRKRSVFVKFAHDKLSPGYVTYPDAPFGWTNRYLMSQKTVYEDDTGCGGAACYSQLDYSHFDGLGHFRQATTSGNFAAGNVRSTTTGFNPDPATGNYLDYTVDDSNNVSGGYAYLTTGFPLSQPWILNTYGNKEQAEGGVTAHSDYCFEKNGSNYPTTGFLVRSRAYTNGTSPGATDVVGVFSRDGNGNTTSEQYYGGDSGGVGTTGLCSFTVPANSYRIDHAYQYGSLQTSRFVDGAGTPLTFYSADYDIDLNTGLIASSHTASGGTKGQSGYDLGLVTDYQYDALGRLTWTKPRATPVDGGAWVNYVYIFASGFNPAKVSISSYPNGTTSGALTQQEYTYDGFGRVIKQRQLLASGLWNQRLTTYSALGWKLSVSELQADGTSGSAIRNTVYQNFDPFGRPQTITPPDGTAHNVTVTYAGARQVQRTVTIGTSTSAESSATTTETYDRQGRLSTVAEPSGSGGTVVTTTYGYDVGSRLHTVSTSSGSITQNRVFTYDNRGFLTSEQHPEKGATGNGSVTYSSYDARGHAGRVTDGPNDIGLVYDRAERLNQAKIYNTTTLLKEFSYGSANTTGNYVNGKLSQAKRHNWSGTSDEQVTETYTYGGVGGGVSQRSTSVGLLLPSTDTRTISQTFGWNDLGAPSSVGYPDDTGISTDPSRTVSFTYTNGFLTAVPSYASSLSYYPNTMVNQVVHANGVTDTYGKDPNDMARPASIATSGAATNWSTGTYQYDGAGDVWKIGSDWYLYDLVTRLKEGNVGSVTQKQCAVFDAFGNIFGLSQIASSGTCPTTGSYALDSSTNRFLSPVTYDAAGNETYRGGTTYTWDKWSQMAAAVGTGVNRAYLYTADGERIGERDNTASTITVTVRGLDNKGLRIFTKSGGTWTWSKDYVYRNGLLLASVESAGTKHFHLDHLGTVRRITGTGTPAAVLASHDYYPFGLEATSPSQDTERMKYTGHERDSSTGLDYMHARHYTSVVGRFVSTDPTPKSIDVKLPQSFNRYAYVENQPVGKTDPKGTCIDACVVEGTLLLAVTAKAAADLTAWLNAQSPVRPGMTNGQALVDSVRETFTTLFRPGPPDNWQRQKDAAQSAKILRESSVGGTNGPRPPGPGDDLPPGAPGPSYQPKDLGPSPDETDIFRWTQPTFPLAGAATGLDQNLQDQAKKDLLQHFYDAYGLGPYLQSDPGSFTDALGNTVQDPDPR